jgi:hypothetical protein
MGEDAANHRVIGVVCGTPIDHNVGMLGPGHLGEGEWGCRGQVAKALRTAWNSPAVSAVPSSKAKVRLGFGRSNGC